MPVCGKDLSRTCANPIKQELLVISAKSDRIWLVSILLDRLGHAPQKRMRFMMVQPILAKP